MTIILNLYTILLVTEQIIFIHGDYPPDTASGGFAGGTGRTVGMAGTRAAVKMPAAFFKFRKDVREGCASVKTGRILTAAMM